MEDLIEIVLKLKEATKHWNAKCKKRFYFQSVTLPGDKYPYRSGRLDTGLYRTVKDIEALADKYLIGEGGSHIANETLLEKYASVKIVTLERDSFGPLRKGIVIGHGVVCYG